jgi:cobalt transporter subunit CbtB
LSALRGNVAFLKEHHVSTTSAVTPVSTPIVSAQTRTVVLLAATALLALLVYYFVGVDEGAVSVFGKSMVIHELFHDGRHVLGFPCH